MKSLVPVLLFPVLALAAVDSPTPLESGTMPSIREIQPPEEEFFSKQLEYQGIPIKAHAVVSDEAMRQAYQRLEMMLVKLPAAAIRLREGKVELHIIGKDQVTTDLPEWRQDKGKKLEEYNGLTRDERTRGMGGRLVSCGEENLMKLDKDKYHGRDICVHEFAHAIQFYGMDTPFKSAFSSQYKDSKSNGLWAGSYAGSNDIEFFAELTMWYFGTHGDMNMTGAKPESGREGLKAYDPVAFSLIERFYEGQELPAR